MCGKSGALSCLVRYLQLFVILFGVALIAYAIYFGVKSSSFGAPSGVPLALGVVESLLGIFVFTCTQSLCFLRLNLMIGDLLTIAELVTSILFMVPSTSDKIIEAMSLNSDVQTFVKDNISYVGYILISIAAIKSLSTFLILIHMCRVSSNSTRDVDNEDAAGLLGSTYRFGSGGSFKKQGLLPGDRFSALADEGETEGAADRYRQRNAHMYSKYTDASKR